MSAPFVAQNDGEAVSYFSASQISTFELCPRKWAWKYVNKVEILEEEDPSLKLGKDVHEELERWLRDGIPLNLTTEAGQIAMSGLHLLPSPKTPGLEIEKMFGLEMGGHKFLGYKDFQMLNVYPPIVGEHKTTKNFKWIKDRERMLSDPQATLYAADIMFRAGTQECDLYWVYYRTTGAKKSEPLHLRVTRDDIAPRLVQTIQTADEMAAIKRSGTRAEAVACNRDSCRAYNRDCEYLALCATVREPTPEERMRAIMTQQKEADVMAQLSERQMNGMSNGINPPSNFQQQFTPPAPQQGFAPPAPQQQQFTPPAPQYAPGPAPQQFTAPAPQQGQYAPGPAPQPYPQAAPQQYAQPQPQGPAQQQIQWTPPPGAYQDPQTGQWVMPQGAPQVAVAGPAPARRGRKPKAEGEENGGLILVAQLLEQCAQILRGQA